VSILAFAPWQYLLDGLGWCLAQIYSVVPNYAAAIIILTVLIRLLLLPFGFKQIKSMQHMQALQPELKALQKKYKNNKQKLQEEQMKMYREAGVNPLGGCLPLLLTLPFLFAMYAVIRPPVLAPNSTVVAPITAAANVSGNVAQFTVAQPLSLKDGDIVVVSGMTPGDYNGEWTASSVSGSSFQADIGGTPPTATAFGTAGPRDSYIPLNNHLPTSSTLFFNVATHQNLDVLSVNLQCSLQTSGKTVP
jgi:YidC/Oxa1 family membrane protein insertase